MPTLLDLSPARAVPVFDTIRDDDFAPAVAARAGEPADEVAKRIADIASEAELALTLLRSLGPLTADTRVLEVGAGPGVIAGVLHSAGAKLVAIEPLQSGFDLFAAVRAELAERLPAAAAPLDRRPAEQLDPDKDGPFDLIFSVNVLEHCHPLEPSLDALAGVLAPGGRMLHTCPNYRVPYEPHYAMPLVPGKPALTTKLRPQLADEPLWQSLNWITARDVTRFAERHQLDLTLRAGVLGEAVARLRTDPAFARRQGLTGKVAAGLARTGALNWLGSLPPAWVTPMVFELSRPE
jgi:SAM-dependent methyltransferase